jgi:seryl-tRNA synthetase
MSSFQPASSTPPQPVPTIQTKETFTEAVQRYVSMDQQYKSHQNKVKEFRDARTKLENLITEYMARNRISTIKISDGQLQLASQSTAQPVTLTLLKESLDEFFKADLTLASNVFEYIKSKRVVKHETYIKRMEENTK